MYGADPYHSPDGSDSELEQLRKTGLATGGRNPIQEQRYQELLKGTPEAKQTDFFNKQKGDVTDFLGRYNTATTNAVNDANTKYGVTDHLNAVNALNSRIKDLQGNISGYGAGGYASGAQVDKAINTKYLPAYSAESQNLNTSASLAQNEAKQKLAPMETEGQMLNDRLAREMTGFTNDQQAELQTYLQKMQQGFQLTEAQMQKANALAAAQLDYEKAIDVQNLKNESLKSMGKYGGMYMDDNGVVHQVGGGGGAGGGETFQ